MRVAKSQNMSNIEYQNSKNFEMEITKQYKKILTKKFLLKEYIRKRKSVRLIRIKTNCPASIIKYYLRKYRYKIRGEIRKILCKNCKKEISKRAIRCRNCEGKRRTQEANKKYLRFTNKLKEQIRKRDNYICQKCNIKQEHYYRKLDIHHIDYNKRNYNKNNLISLCNSCNCQVNKNRFFWKVFFKLKIK